MAQRERQGSHSWPRLGDLFTTVSAVLRLVVYGSMAGRKTDETLLDCPVCLLAFDDSTHRPRIPPCGHSVCTSCINELTEDGHVSCPECRVKHAVPREGQFPVSYTLEGVIRSMRNLEATETGQEGGGAFSARMRSLLQEQKTEVKDAIIACQKVQSQLDQYQTSLTNWEEQQQRLKNMLQKIMDQSNSAIELVQKEQSRAAAKKDEVNKSEVDLRAVLKTLHTLTPKQEAGAAVTELFRCTSRAEKVLKECQESFPDANMGPTIRKIREESSAAVEAALTPKSHSTFTTEELGLPSNRGSIMGKLWAIVPPSWKDLRIWHQLHRSMFEDGLVFAVQQVEGECRHARISLEDGQLYLHRLQENLPPRNSKVLQMSQVVPPSPPCLVFLDLSWPGFAPRRVKVRLSQDTPRGRQFALLCTGQRGPTYAGTRLVMIRNKGQPGEWVRGGDYEHNNGTGRAVLLPGLNEGQYFNSGKAGDVFGLVLTGKTRGESGQFGIITLDKPEGSTCPFVFGEVVDGLHVVVEASKHTNIKEVFVKDCGVVL